jgi:DNA-directed RNA polymerase subunit M/transcription elongation factor TFIIS
MPDIADLSCSDCPYTTVCGPVAMLDWLRRVRMVRNDVAPEPELLGELFRSAADKFHCPRCGTHGMIVGSVHQEDEENDEAWGMARRCDDCGEAISSERLQALPESRRCAACQARDERGEASGPQEYCPKCGSIMVVRQTRGAGLTRYQLICPSCRR